MYLRVSYAQGVDIQSAAKEAFGEVSFINRQGGENEAAFITPQMTVKSFNELAQKLTQSGEVKIESRIRMGDDL